MQTAYKYKDRDYVVFFEHYEPVCIDLGTAAFANLSADFLLRDETPSVLFVIGSSSATRNGSYNEMSLMMLRNHLPAYIVSGISEEPGIEDVRRIVDSLKTYSCDEVVAIGGGSVMDAAKAAWLSYQCGLDIKDLFGANKASLAFPNKKFKTIIAVPTTAGTGSEVTPYACIADETEKVKYMVSDRQIMPRLALVNPDYCMTMSAKLTVSTALDALVHNIEAMLNTAPKGIAALDDKWPVRAISMIVDALPSVLENPSAAPAREALSVAATLGGIAITHRPTGLPHLASYSFYGRLSHGLSVALLLIPFWRFSAELPEVAAQTMKLAGIFPSATSQLTPKDVIDAASQFIYGMSGINGLKSLDFFNDAMVERIARDSIRNPMKLESAPRPISIKDAENVISGILMKELQ